jgi:DNA-binding transcriptional regulator YhcF (GntR family)
MDPDIVVDPDAGIAPYEQVRLRIADLAATGRLSAGEKLPPVRTLATRLGLAANTVARAYKELEQAGLVETRGRAGTVVTARATRTPAAAQTIARRYAEQAGALGLSPQQALDLVRAALHLPAG